MARTIWLIISMVGLVLSFSLIATGQEPVGRQVVKGYLVDKQTALDFLQYENPESKAKAYTKQQALSKEAQKKGYGILSGVTFLPFDGDGSKQAKKLFERTSKQAGLYVEAEVVRREKVETFSRTKDTMDPLNNQYNLPPGTAIPSKESESGANIRLGSNDKDFEVWSLKEVVGGEGK